MFCQIPTEEQSIVSSSPKKRKQKGNKNKKKLRKLIKKKDLKFVKSMSTWAENFATATTWQLKHQVAFWKARAKALEYENKVLHDVIRRNHCELSTNECEKKESEAGSDSENDQNENNEYDFDDQHENNDLEVSEEFIQFLTANAQFKEDARMERERLRANEQENDEEEEPPETFEKSKERMKKLYGDKWQKIAALEMSLATTFLNYSDANKPVYWPNLPLNFNY